MARGSERGNRTVESEQGEVRARRQYGAAVIHYASALGIEEIVVANGGVVMTRAASAGRSTLRTIGWAGHVVEARHITDGE